MLIQADRYHWAFIFGPKEEKDGTQGVRYHAMNRVDKWVFEERSTSLEATNMLLVRDWEGGRYRRSERSDA